MKKILFRVVYAIYKGDCVYHRIFRETVSLDSNSFRGSEIVGRFIGVRSHENHVEGCLRISYTSQRYLENLLNKLKTLKVKYKIIYKGKNNVIIYFKHNICRCGFCPIIRPIEYAVPKTILVTPLGLLFEFIAMSNAKFSNEYFEILVSGCAKEMIDYLLTSREEEVLYYAYFRGYYSNPRRVRLSELSKELGISKSTLNEILRNAERKIVTAYMRHDLPHLILEKILGRETHRSYILSKRIS